MENVGEKNADDRVGATYSSYTTTLQNAKNLGKTGAEAAGKITNFANKAVESATSGSTTLTTEMNNMWQNVGK